MLRVLLQDSASCVAVAYEALNIIVGRASQACSMLVCIWWYLPSPPSGARVRTHGARCAFLAGHPALEAQDRAMGQDPMTAEERAEQMLRPRPRQLPIAPHAPRARRQLPLAP